MMSVLQDSLTLVRETGGAVDLAQLPPDDPAVYRSLQEADTIGVFQVESRAQMATLPRVRPERFYDLVVQVAIIRPGPIVGDMVHPYIRRRRGREPVTYPHPSLEPILRRTLGVPLFQEQLLRMAMVTAGFTATEAEELRRAFGFKRSERLMAEVETKLRAGMARQGIHGAAAEEIVHAITAFALYGFPESHASSFALLAYASAYLQRPPLGGVLRGAAQQPADGLLSPGDHREGRAATRPAYPADRCHALAVAVHDRADRRAAARRCGWACGTSGDCASGPAARSSRAARRAPFGSDPRSRSPRAARP